MATLVKRGNKYNVIYYYELNGERKQKWESFNTFDAAKKRKIEIESDQEKGVFVNPTNMTVKEFLDTFVEIYGKNEWAVTTYTNNVALIKNYVLPFIGKYKVQSVTPLMIEQYYSLLRKSDSYKPVKNGAKKIKVTEGTVQNVHKLLKTAFKQGVMWGILSQNPFDRVRKPKVEYAKRDIWTSEQIATALRACTDPRVSLAMQLSFACSLRIGEILGLTWDCLHISDEDIDADDAYLIVNKQLKYVDLDLAEDMGGEDILKVFPQNEGIKYGYVFTPPKTDSSNRKVWIPETLARFLQQWRLKQQEYKDFFQEEYQDDNLVICLEDGRPCSKDVIEHNFENLILETGLPRVVFHSLRHSSATYKLKLNKGDIKATQGDTGHAQADMVTEVYGHIIDEDRKVNAQRFDESFYKKGGDIDRKNKKIDIDALVKRLKDDPQVLDRLTKLLENKEK